MAAFDGKIHMNLPSWVLCSQMKTSMIQTGMYSIEEWGIYAYEEYAHSSFHLSMQQQRLSYEAYDDGHDDAKIFQKRLTKSGLSAVEAHDVKKTIDGVVDEMLDVPCFRLPVLCHAHDDC